MPRRIKNVSGNDRTVPGLGGRLVISGAIVEVADEDVEAYLQQPAIWADPDATPEPEKKPARKTAAKKAAASHSDAAPAESED